MNMSTIKDLWWILKEDELLTVYCGKFKFNIFNDDCLIFADNILKVYNESSDFKFVLDLNKVSAVSRGRKYV